MAYGRFRRKAGVKYNNTKITLDGITFDSKHEMERYCQLRLLERAGVIRDLELQKVFELIPNQYKYEARYGKNGKPLKDKEVLLERKVVYRADFVYTDKDGKTVVEDVKGFRTTEYVLKRKMFLYKYGFPITEI